MNKYNVAIVYKARYVGDKSRYAIERTNADGTKTILGQAASKKATEAKLAIYRA